MKNNENRNNNKYAWNDFVYYLVYVVNLFKNEVIERRRKQRRTKSEWRKNGKRNFHCFLRTKNKKNMKKNAKKVEIKLNKAKDI